MTDSFPVDDALRASVTESEEELRYSFIRRDPGPRSSFPIGLVVIFVIVPFGLIGAILYALDQQWANRAEWELVLVGTLVLQLLAWSLFGISGLLGATVRYWADHDRSNELVFTRDRLTHRPGAGRITTVCEFDAVRGVRLFIYRSEQLEEWENVPPSESKPSVLQGGLSLLVGPDEHTYGVFLGFAVEGMTRLAEDMHRRLTRFRFNQGLVESLAPIEITETTEERVVELCHTLPANPRQAFRKLTGWGFLGILQNRWLASLWCVTALGGIFAASRLLIAARLGPVCLVFFPLALFHITLLLFALTYREKRSE
jgi:hypothetical protein